MFQVLPLLRNYTQVNIIVEGTPVDALDEACMNWHKCQACTTIDDDQCNHYERYEVDYSILTNYLYNMNLPGSWPGWPTEPKPDCSANTNVCDLGRCLCDVELSTRLANLFIENFKAHRFTINHEFITNDDGSGFDHKNKCNVGLLKTPSSGQGSSSGGLSPEMSCCGNYPNRKPYNVFRQTCCGKGETGAQPFLVGFGAC